MGTYQDQDIKSHFVIVACGRAVLKQLEKCLFKQLAFSAFVVAASTLFEEVRVGIVVLVLLICLSVPQNCLLVGCRLTKKACLGSRRAMTI